MHWFAIKSMKSVHIVKNLPPRTATAAAFTVFGIFHIEVVMFILFLFLLKKLFALE